MSSLSFNFILSRELVMTVNIPVQERNATVGSLLARGVRHASTKSY